MEIEVLKLFKNILRKWPYIAIATIVVSVIVFIFSTYYMTPKYESYITLYVTNTTNINNDNITSGDLASSQELVNTYVVLLHSNLILDQVIQNAGLKYTVDQLGQMLVETAVNRTQLLRIAVQSKDPNEAQLIASSIGKIAPDEFRRIVKAGNVELVDDAILANKPYSPNVIFNALLGGIFALFVTSLGFALHEILDTKIKSEQDVCQWTSLPVIGIIPKIDTDLYNGGKN